MPSHSRSVIGEVTGNEGSNICVIGKNVLLRDGSCNIKITIGDSAVRIQFGYYLRLDIVFKWMSPEIRCLEKTINDIQIVRDSGFPGGNHIPLMHGLAV